MRRRSFALLLGCIAGVALSGCGYGLVGRGGSFDPSIRKVAVPLFRDGTGRTNIDQKITQKVIEELLKRGRIDVTQNIEGADAVVEGEILSVQQQPIGITDQGVATTASRYSITVTAKVRYYKPGAPEPIWQNDAFVFRDEYDMGASGASFFDREDQSVERLAQAFARSLVSAMLEAF